MFPDQNIDNNIKLGLENTKEALAFLFNPQDSFFAIHIAGTNGKGSVCRFLELLYLKLTKLKIAKYTSPHLISPCERFHIDGEMISETRFNDLWFKLFQSIDSVLVRENIVDQLTGFEKMTVLAFQYFKEENVDVAILEVGLGGRLDATNVISPSKTLATAITSIGMDHMNILGNTLEEIRTEKEGIMKPSVPHFELDEDEKNPELFPNDPFGDNLNLALRIYESINDFKVETKFRYEFSADFKKNYPGRFEFDQDKNILMDAAHNAAASKQLNKYIKLLVANNFFTRKIFLLAYLQDKIYQDCLRELLSEIYDPKKDIIIFTEVKNDRTQKAELLQSFIEENYALTGFSQNLYAFNESETALKKVKELKADKDLLIVSGSIYLLGEVRSSYGY